MEPPSKRPRLSIPDPDPAVLADHDDDETNPVDLEAARARNDQRLKSIFESIFEKYEKDFTEVGDEIDLQSGRIIVNNGHLQRMEGEDDTGEKDAEWLAGLATPVVDHREEESGSETETGGDGYEEDAAAAAASGGSRLWSGSRRSLPADGALEGIRDDEPTGATDADADAGEYTDAYCDSNYDEGEDEDEDDDTSSVDSLLDAATSVHHADNNRPAQVTARTHTTTIPITEKAIPGSEAAGAFSRIRAADYYSHLNSTSDEQEPVDSKWRVPEIDAKFVTPTTWSRTLPISPSSNNTKQESKTNAVRSASPPGARSLWALPHPGRPRKTNTDVPYQKKKRNTDASNKKERNTDAPNQKERNAAIPNQKKNNTGAFNQEERDTDIPNQKKKDTDVLNQKERNKDISASAKKVPLDAPPPTSIGQPKPKPFLSPVVANDWSFAAASDGSESDDPLQEDHQPSPTPKTVLNIRGKRIGSSAPLSGSQSRCNGCKGLFSSNDDHVLHLRSVLASNLPDTLHDRTIVKKILERIDEAHARDTDSRPKSIDSPPAHESPGNPGSPEIPGNPASPGSPGSPGSSASPGSPTPKDTVINENQSATIKPKQKKGKYAPITPSDAKILITMRHVQKKQWKEILEYIPGKRSKNLMQWNKFHWVERRTHPPQLSRPWSLDEREKLSAFVDPQGMTWPGIRAELAGRSSAEIECEIFRLWVGDEVWNSEEGQPVESKGHHYQDQRKGDNGDLDTSAATNLEGVALADQDEPNSDVDSTVGDYLEIPDSTESSVIGADLEDIHDLYNLEPNPEYSKMLHSGQKSISPEPYNAGRRIITLKYGRKR